MVRVAVYYVLKRYFYFIPYTAALFLIRTIMGVAIAKVCPQDQPIESIVMWEDINGKVLLLIFLPGSLLKDAYGLNYHLFTKGFSQLLIMAFPMVLSGTYLTALVGYFMLPYGLNFNFSMTFGAILAATDPVAVSALLNELGATLRLVLLKL